MKFQSGTQFPPGRGEEPATTGAIRCSPPFLEATARMAQSWTTRRSKGPEGGPVCGTSVCVPSAVRIPVRWRIALASGPSNCDRVRVGLSEPSRGPPSAIENPGPRWHLAGVKTYRAAPSSPPPGSFLPTTLLAVSLGLRHFQVRQAGRFRRYAGPGPPPRSQRQRHTDI